MSKQPKSFFNYSDKEKKEILMKAAKESNKAQKELMDTQPLACEIHHRILIGKDRCVDCEPKTSALWCYTCEHTVIKEGHDTDHDTKYRSDSPSDCYCMCHSIVSSCPACEHCKPTDQKPTWERTK